MADRPRPPACLLEGLCFPLHDGRPPGNEPSTAHAVACAVAVGTYTPRLAPTGSHRVRWPLEPCPWPVDTPLNPQQVPGDTTNHADQCLPCAYSWTVPASLLPAPPTPRSPRWLDAYGYPPTCEPDTMPPELTKREALDRFSQHTQHCNTCKRVRRKGRGGGAAREWSGATRLHCRPGVAWCGAGDMRYAHVS